MVQCFLARNNWPAQLRIDDGGGCRLKQVAVNPQVLHAASGARAWASLQPSATTHPLVAGSDAVRAVRRTCAECKYASWHRNSCTVGELIIAEVWNNDLRFGRGRVDDIQSLPSQQGESEERLTKRH